MSLNIEVQKKSNRADMRKITTPEDVFKLKEVQEIKDAIQEYFLFIGLDRGNHIRDIRIMGIGTSQSVQIDSKQIIRTALITATEKVIFVHNHPSNTLNPSGHDKYLSNVTNKLLEAFNIELIDHIIVSEDNYLSMMEVHAIDKNYSDEKMNFMEKAFLVEENNSLKHELENLKNSNVEEVEDDEEVL